MYWCLLYVLLWLIKNIDTPNVAKASDSDGDKTTLQGLIDTIDNLYRTLLKTGYKLNEIEDMDLFYFLFLSDEEQEEEKFTPIDQIIW